MTYGRQAQADRDRAVADAYRAEFYGVEPPEREDGPVIDRTKAHMMTADELIAAMESGARFEFD